MKVKAIRIKNYKSFVSTQDLLFSDRFNIIVGKNNTGKTAFVESLGLRLPNRPHISTKTIFKEGDRLSNHESSVNITFEMEGQELIEIFKDKNIKDIYIPAGGDDINFQIQKFKESFSDQITFTCDYKDNKFVYAYHSDCCPEVLGNNCIKAMQFKYSPVNDQIKYIDTNKEIPLKETLAMKVAPICKDRIYFFNADRPNIGKSKIGTNTDLSSSPDNLAQVLHLLQTSDPLRFQNFKAHVSSVFPEIKEITIPPVPGSDKEVEILVWPCKERKDLAIPLSQSGTGIAQVLAILYVAINSDYPRVIIIDEPQSFIHPSTIRKLFDILRKYPIHQYFISTHSTTVINSSFPKSMYMLTKQGQESTVNTINTEETEQLNTCLLELGIRLSDVFGADNILWVEGTAQEICFPIIHSSLSTSSSLGTAIRGMLNTGSTQNKDSRKILKIYKRLNGGLGLLPTTKGIIFDREGRSQKEQEDLIREGEVSNIKIDFIKRRMYENYLLNPKAIASILSEIKESSDYEITEEKIKTWLDNIGKDEKYTAVSEDLRGQPWIFKVHGEKILEDIFSFFSENSVVYDKVQHGKMLTEWILKHSSDDLKEIIDLITNILDKDSIKDQGVYLNDRRGSVGDRRKNRIQHKPTDEIIRSISC